MHLAGMNKRVSRRSLLGGSLVLAGGAIIAACSPAAPPTNTPAPAKPAEPTKPAAAATTAPAAAATTAPAAAATTAPAAATKPAAAPTTAPAAGATTAAPAAAPQTSGQVVTLRIHDWAQDPNDTFYGPLFKKFEEEHPGIKIQREWFPRDDLHTKELQLAATGQIGDTVRYNVAVNGPELRNKGVVQPLTPFIQKDTKWAQNDQKQFFPGNIANYTAQGQQWGYPVVGHPGCLQYYINTDMAAKVGAKLPDASSNWHWTFDQAMDIFAKGTQKGADGRVAVYGNSPCLGNEGVVGVLRAFGANVYSDDGTKCLIGSDEAIQGIQWIADQFNKNKVALPLDAGGKQTDVLTVFPTSKIMTFVSTSSQPGNLHRLIGEGKQNNFKWMILPPPTVKAGDKFPTQISSDGYGMSKQTKYPDQAWEVVKLYASKEHGLNRNLAGLGSPGSRYDVWTDDKFRQNAPELTLIYDTLLNPDKAPPALPWNNPANGRYFEADTAMNNALVDVWLGNKTAKEVLPELQKTMQAIMDKPPV
ncbi:MAG TPA: extracellular solute-binding protein [Chloroflexota bacterium]|nr:extracellular solute-binding protein [Chloroflexota bacterium]